MKLLSDFIHFKEQILRQVDECRLFTANYPLLIEHILREAKMYRAILMEIIYHKSVSRKKLGNMEDFWNRIMMEHALFIRGLLDSTQEQLIETADQYAKEYKELLADHVLREANHYIRLLETEEEG